MPPFKLLLSILFIACVCSLGCAHNPTNDLAWSSVQLNGKHLRLVSPTSSGDSEDLYFSGQYLAITSCNKGLCTSPLTVWKIENNRLKTGYVTDAGDVLVKFTDKTILLRRPDGKSYVYAISPK